MVNVKTKKIDLLKPSQRRKNKYLNIELFVIVPETLTFTLPPNTMKKISKSESTHLEGESPTNIKNSDATSILDRIAAKSKYPIKFQKRGFFGVDNLLS